jgi:membrane-bound metal-dependent hydrolase YbcI (DUF457 family)
MYFFFHLLTGIVLGFLISDLLKDRRWLLPCSIGAILPDLIDKPLGYLLFPTTIGNGRIFVHSFLIVIILLVLGLVFWKKMHDPGILGLCAGILSHQILDLMWLYPKSWYFPLLGPFSVGWNDDFFFTMLLEELDNPVEMCLMIIIGAGIVALIYRHEITPFVRRYHSVFSPLMAVGALLLCTLSGILIGGGIARQTLRTIGWKMPQELIIGGVVIALSAWLLWRWHTVVDEECLEIR